MNLDLTVATIAKLDLAPGDVLVLTVPTPMNSDQRRSAMDTMMQFLPGVSVLILDSGTTISKLCAVDAAALAPEPAPC